MSFTVSFAVGFVFRGGVGFFMAGSLVGMWVVDSGWWITGRTVDCFLVAF
jgi:hypothetical protein